MVVGMAIGLFISINGFLIPDYFSGEYIHFGRVRPVHVMGILLLWLLPANIGLTFYFVPRLCGTKIRSPYLAKISAILYWIGSILAHFSYPMGTNYGWEYAETPNWVLATPVKAVIIFSWLLVVVNLLMTFSNRTVKKLYVSLWYVLALTIWVTIVFLVGGYYLEFLPYGISRVNTHFFYIHTLVGFIFTPFGLAAAYYFLPKLANVPIYSHRLSMIGFWSIAFVYGWVGVHHLIHGPISQWIQTVSIVFSIWLFIPVWTVVFNIFMTLQPRWKKYTEDPAIRFIAMGNIFYLLVSMQGSFMALRNVNEITSKTDWIIGHSHMALYGAFTFFAIAGIYYVIPQMTGNPIRSKKLADWHFSLNLLGSLPFMLSLWIGGYLQGLQWASWADGISYVEYQSHLSQLPFLQTVADAWIWWFWRSVGGLIILIANILFVVNIYNTVVLKRKEIAYE